MYSGFNMELSSLHQRYISLFLLLLAFSATVFASPLPKHLLTRNHGAPAPRTIYQFPNGTQLENVAVRHNGHILVTPLSSADLYEVDPFAGSAKLVHTFSKANGLLGITEIEKDVFAVISGVLDRATNVQVNGSFIVWRVDLTRESAIVSQIVQVAESQVLNGITPLNGKEKTVLISDSTAGVVWRLNTETGSHAIVLDDALLKPNPAFPPVGVNGVKVRDGYLYFTNSFQEIFCRVKVDLHTGKPLAAIEVVATGVFGDDFALGKGGDAYVAGNPLNVITKVGLDGTAKVIAGGLNDTTVAGATSAAFGRTGRDEDVLYVVTNGAKGLPVNGTFTEGGKVVAVPVSS
jgi:predicted secreted protein